MRRWSVMFVDGVILVVEAWTRRLAELVARKEREEMRMGAYYVSNVVEVK
jgi:hypothetical protein